MRFLVKNSGPAGQLVVGPGLVAEAGASYGAAGMILAGSEPVYAAIYQFVVVGMIYASSGLTSLISTLLMRGRAFSPAEQLVLETGRS